MLVGLAVAVAFIPLKVASEKQELKEKQVSLIQRKVAPLTNLDLTLPQTALKRVASPVVLDFSSPHRLFNAMPWQKTAAGQLVKYDDSRIGPKAVTITKVTPLHLIISLDSVSVSAESQARYVIGVQKEAAATPAQRIKKGFYCKLNEKNDLFTLRKVDGPADNPAKLTLEFNDTGEMIVVTKEQPYTRVDGYMADLKYVPENKTWTSRRVGSPPLAFNGEEYNIVAISQNEVVLSAKSNQKKWPIPYQS